MDITKLTTIGLTPIQAEIYVLLMEHGELKPTTLVDELKLTRTNSYKLLDRLVEMGLATKIDVDKKFVYKPTNPIALSALADHYRAKAIAREEAAHSLTRELLDAYYKHTKKPTVKTFSGKDEVIKAYRRQSKLHEDVYFIRTKADISAMGFDTMHEIRVAPGRHGNWRYGILGTDTGVINHESHKRGNLTTTIMDHKLYTAPVEWSVTDSSLLLVSYTQEPQAILIMDPTIALAFKQLWGLLNNLLREQPAHQQYGPPS